MFDQSGGVQSERVYMKQFIQKFLGEVPENEDLFNAEEVEQPY